MSANKRSANFNFEEIAKLMELVKKYKNIIENKKSDQVFLGEKLATWKKIADEFNSSSTLIYRDFKTLKSKYENIKKTSKKKFAEEKRQVYATGGGPSANIEFNEIDQTVVEILQDQVLGMPSVCDNDYLYSSEY